ncbi:MAG TPA: prolipoprotein diacylglyceryl transferase [Dehalococcoidia bacterium]|nr:prolipoprotein diacylglyceryl transferase [Dehalococcoidia bacterium]
MTISIDPVAFSIGPVDIRWYGIFIALAIVWLVVWMLWQKKRGAEFSYDTIFTGFLVGIPSGVIISRLLHVLDNIVVAKVHPELAAAGQVIDYTQDPGRIIGFEGLTAYGAVLGAALGVWIYCKITKLDMGHVSHTIAPAIIAAQAIGRIGCTLNGCCYGVACNLPWAIEYTNPGTEAFGAGTVHPTQIYEIIFNLIVFGVLWKLMSKVRTDGTLFLIYLALYSAWRVGIDFIRPGNPFLFDLHQAQVIGIIVLVITIPLLVRRWPWFKKEETPLQQELEVS